MTQNAAAGWYPDPQNAGVPGQQRWWDGERWTDHVTGGAAPPAVAPPVQQSSQVVTNEAKQWAMAAHLSALPAAFVGLAFIGPLLVYLLKKDDHPFIRQEAAEALNFNLSVLIYAVAGGILLAILILLIIGIVLIPVAIAAVVAWLVLVVVAGIKAGKGEPYRYPVTIRFVD